jgi:MYXO-CTERM domain-containing protein
MATRLFAAVAVAVCVALLTTPASAVTITVDTTAQATATSAADGKCSLAEAIAAANGDTAVDTCPAGLGADVVQIPAGNYELLLPYVASDPNTALPAVTTSVTLQGPTTGAATITFNAAATTLRFIGVQAPGKLTLERLTFTKCKYTDALSNGASLVVNDCTFQGNGVTSNPSAQTVIRNHPSATLTIADSKFLSNDAVAIRHGDNTGTISVDNVEFTANHTTALDTRAATVTVSKCTFDQNTALNRPAGIVTQGTLSVVDSAFTNNAGTGDTTGVLRNDGGTTTLTRCTFSGNQGVNGGALENTGSGTLTIRDSTFSKNTAAGAGGAIRLIGASGSVSLFNCTLSGNSAGTEGGGIASDSQNTVLNNVTITGNSAGSRGGGLSLLSNANPGTFTFSNTIVAGNSNPSASPDCAADSGKFLISKGHNLVGNSTGCTVVAGTGDQVGTGAAPIAPLLAALGANGGTTETHALAVTSPALDKGNPSASGDGVCEPTDQVGTTRPVGTACDIGAFEGSVGALDGGAGAGGSAGSAGSGASAGVGGSTGGGAGAGGSTGGTGGSSVDGGKSPGGSKSSSDDGGCGCHTGAKPPVGGVVGFFAFFGFLLARRRRRRRETH